MMTDIFLAPPFLGSVEHISSYTSIDTLCFWSHAPISISRPMSGFSVVPKDASTLSRAGNQSFSPPGDAIWVKEG